MLLRQVSEIQDYPSSFVKNIVIGNASASFFVACDSRTGVCVKGKAIQVAGPRAITALNGQRRNPRRQLPVSVQVTPKNPRVHWQLPGQFTHHLLKVERTAPIG